jgi:DNA-binding NarL/FixJ family response regulator
MNSQVVTELKTWSEALLAPTVLIAKDLHEDDVMVAVECRVAAILYSAEVSSDQLTETILSVASGHGALPPDLLGHLMGAVRRLQQDVLTPRGLNVAGFTSREVDVLRLMAEGHDTAEIARQLSYSDRTVKAIIWTMTSRLKLRNRPHVVAHAIRSGVI